MKRLYLIFLLCVSWAASCWPIGFQSNAGKQATPEIATSPLSGECTEADFAKFGRPIMLEMRKGIFLGISVAVEHAPLLASFPVYFWIQNRSDEVQWLSSCSDVDRFRMYGFSVYDSQGHRLPSRWEGEHNTTIRSDDFICESTAEGPILPHTCRAPERSEAYDLTYVYSLSPGQYTLRLADLSSGKPDPEGGDSAKPKERLTGEQPDPSLAIRIDALQTSSAGQMQDDPTPLPKECADAELEKLGRPVMVDECGGKVLYGFSVGAGQAIYGQEVPIYFWLVNQSDAPQSVMTCDMQWFQRDGLDVFDAAGKRLLPRDEQKNPRYDRSRPSRPFNYICSINMILTLAPHSCRPPQHAYNLGQRYDLPEGGYVISPRNTIDCARPHAFGKEAVPRVHPGRLTISIRPPREAANHHSRGSEKKMSSEVVP